MKPVAVLRMRSTSTGGGGSSYVETGVVGNSTDFTLAYSMGNNEQGVYSITVPSGGVWVKTAHLQVQTTTAGNKFKPILFTGIGATDTVIKVGQEFVFPTTIPSGSVEYSTNLNADGSAYFIPAGTYGFGYLASGNTDVKAAGGTVHWAAQTYATGPASPFGTFGSSSRNPAIWMPYSVTGP